MQAAEVQAQVPPAETGARAVARHSAVIVAAGFAGKILAVVRDAAIAHGFGGGAATDALFLALSIPNTFASIVAGGGFRVAFQPELARRLAGNPARAWSLFTLLAVVLGAASTGLMLVLMGLAGPLSARLSDDSQLPFMVRLLAPMLPLLVMYDLFIGVLHAKLRFTWPALEAVLRNATIAACALFLAPLGVMVIGWGHLGGTALVVAGCVWAARSLGLRATPPDAEDRSAAKRLFSESIWAIVGSSIYPVWALVDRAMAAGLGPGATSALSYADPLWQAGLIVAGPVSIVALPVLADLVAKGDLEGFARTVRTTTRGTVFLTAPLAALLAALAGPAVNLLYLRGKFDAEAATLTAQAVVFLALLLPTTAAQGVTMRALQARGRFRTCGMIALATIVVHIGLNLALMPWMGHRGIALSSALSGLVLVALLDRFMELESPGRWRFLAGLSASFLAAFGTAAGVSHAVPELPSPFVTAVARLALGGLAGGLAYLAVARACRMEEWRFVARVLRRRG